MKITLDYRNPSPSHCDVAVFLNNAFTGTLTLRREELDVFQHIIVNGLSPVHDQFLATGDPGSAPVGVTSGWSEFLRHK
jgi:hypothetical protein